MKAHVEPTLSRRREGGHLTEPSPILILEQCSITFKLSPTASCPAPL